MNHKKVAQARMEQKVLTPHVKQIGTLPTAHPRAAGEQQGHVAQSTAAKADDTQSTAPAPRVPEQP